MRIIARLNIGGPARHAIILSDRLRHRGYETLLVLGSPGPTEGSFEDLTASPAFRVFKLPALGRRVRPFADLRVGLSLVKLIRTERPDIVHTHTAKAGALGRLAAFVCNMTRHDGQKCLVVHTFHGNVLSGYFGRATTTLTRLMEQALARITDVIITISETQRREIVDKFRIAPTDKVAVVPLGLDFGEIQNSAEDRSIRSELVIGSNDVVFGYVGRFVPIKDLPTLMSAFAIVIERVPSAKLLLVGDGDRRHEIESLAAGIRIGDAVRFTGWRRDIGRVYGGVDVVVLASRNEGTPVALIEALAAGRPVVATRVGGVIDVVRDGETGLLVPPGNANALADAMIRLALSASERERMGAAGRRQMIDQFTSDRLVKNIDALYSTALTRKRDRAHATGQPVSRE